MEPPKKNVKSRHLLLNFESELRPSIIAIPNMAEVEIQKEYNNPELDWLH